MHTRPARESADRAPKTHLYTYRRLGVERELVPRESRQQVRFTRAGVPDQDDFEEIVIVVLRAHAGFALAGAVGVVDEAGTARVMYSRRAMGVAPWSWSLWRANYHTCSLLHISRLTLGRRVRRAVRSKAWKSKLNVSL